VAAAAVPAVRSKEVLGDRQDLRELQGQTDTLEFQANQDRLETKDLMERTDARDHLEKRVRLERSDPSVETVLLDETDLME
jgi:hypothetical protein